MFTGQLQFAHADLHNGVQQPPPGQLEWRRAPAEERHRGGLRCRVDQCPQGVGGSRVRQRVDVVEHNHERPAVLGRTYERGHQIGERRAPRAAEVAQHVAIERMHPGNGRSDVQQQVGRIVVEVIDPKPRERTFVNLTHSRTAVVLP